MPCRTGVAGALIRSTSGQSRAYKSQCNASPQTHRVGGAAPVDPKSDDLIKQVMCQGFRRAFSREFATVLDWRGHRLRQASHERDSGRAALTLMMQREKNISSEPHDCYSVTAAWLISTMNFCRKARAKSPYPFAGIENAAGPPITFCLYQSSRSAAVAPSRSEDH